MDGSYLPYPLDVYSLAELYKEVIGDRRNNSNIFQQFNEIIRTAANITSLTEANQSVVNAYCVRRSSVVLSEGLNKIWATVELYSQLKGRCPICDSFNSGFLTSTTIPTLHYANMSLLISLLTLIGVILSRNRRGDQFIYLRQGDNLTKFSRTKYIRWLTGSNQGRGNWHQDLITIARNLLPNLPIIIEFDKLDCIRKIRNYLHYSILSSETLLAQFAEGNYTRCLKVSLDLADTIFKFLRSDLRITSFREDIFKRYEQLNKKGQELISYYNRSLAQLSRVPDCHCINDL